MFAFFKTLLHGYIRCLIAWCHKSLVQVFNRKRARRLEVGLGFRAKTWFIVVEELAHQCSLLLVTAALFIVIVIWSSRLGHRLFELTWGKLFALESWQLLIADVVDVSDDVCEVVLLSFDWLVGYRLDFRKIASTAVSLRGFAWFELTDSILSSLRFRLHFLIELPQVLAKVKTCDFCYWKWWRWFKQTFDWRRFCFGSICKFDILNFQVLWTLGCLNVLIDSTFVCFLGQHIVQSWLA